MRSVDDQDQQRLSEGSRKGRDHRQIWIEVGPRPVPRRLVITYKDEPGSPQYIAELSGWNFQPRLSDHYFTFRPPIGSDEIEFLPPQERIQPSESGESSESSESRSTHYAGKKTKRR